MKKKVKKNQSGIGFSLVLMEKEEPREGGLEKKYLKKLYIVLEMGRDPLYRFTT